MDELNLLTVREVARLLRLSAAAVYGLCKSGRLPHHRLGEGGSAIRIDRADVLAYLRQSKEGAAPSPVGPSPSSSRSKAGLPPVGGFKHLRVDHLLGGRPHVNAPSSDRGGRNAH
jgi:excisionase family DNA binding protein